MKLPIPSIAIAVSSLAFLSCAVQGGNTPVASDQPHARLTTKTLLKSAFPLVMSTTAVHEIDGTRPAFMRWDDTFRIAPGRHVLTLQNIGNNLTAHTLMSFDAKAGEAYVVKSDQLGYLRAKFWIENQATGKIVAAKEEKLGINPAAGYQPIFIPIPAG